jgi:hypothetical protein
MLLDDVPCGGQPHPSAGDGPNHVVGTMKLFKQVGPVARRYADTEIAPGNSSREKPNNRSVCAFIKLIRPHASTTTSASGAASIRTSTSGGKPASVVSDIWAGIARSLSLYAYAPTFDTFAPS